jgi:hypothetical protein
METSHPRVGRYLTPRCGDSSHQSVETTHPRVWNHSTPLIPFKQIVRGRQEQRQFKLSVIKKRRPLNVVGVLIESSGDYRTRTGHLNTASVTL